MSAVLRLDFRRVVRDPKLLVLFGAILTSSFFGPEVREVLGNLSLVFLPVAVGWSWGSDLETGALVPLAIAADGRLRFFAARLVVLAAFAIAALVPLLVDSDAEALRRLLLLGGVITSLLLGFLLVTALRTSHAGWIPLFMAIAVFLAFVRRLPTLAASTPPLWLWLLTSGVLPTWSAGLAPERKNEIPWVLLVSALLFAGATVAILRWRAAALGRRA